MPEAAPEHQAVRASPAVRPGSRGGDARGRLPLRGPPPQCTLPAEASRRTADLEGVDGSPARLRHAVQLLLRRRGLPRENAAAVDALPRPSSLPRGDGGADQRARVRRHGPAAGAVAGAVRGFAEDGRALASVVAGLTDRPVIAVSTSVGYGASFKGIAPLLTMLNSCAQGVAVVNIDNGFGAACFAASITSCQ